MKTEKTNGKQFDLSDLNVKESLQGVQLASFQKRAMAYGLDWLFIIIATEQLAMIVLLAGVFLLFKGKLRSSLQQGSSIINEGVQQLDARLASMNTHEKLREGFTKYLRIYIHVLIILVIVSSLVVAGGMIAGIFYQQELASLKEQSNASLLLQPFKGILAEVNILTSFVGALFYFALFTWRWNGQTPGKRLMNIRVIRLNGKRISIWASFERMSGYTASASMLLLGFFQYYWDRNRQTTHDKITETIVVNMADPQTAILVENVLQQTDITQKKTTRHAHETNTAEESPSQDQIW